MYCGGDFGASPHNVSEAQAAHNKWAIGKNITCAHTLSYVILVPNILYKVKYKML